MKGSKSNKTKSIFAAMLFESVAEELAFRGVMLKRLRGSFNTVPIRA